MPRVAYGAHLLDLEQRVLIPLRAAVEPDRCCTIDAHVDAAVAPAVTHDGQVDVAAARVVEGQ
eukprot:5619168-Prymnesium_polylepis.1